MNFTFYIDSPTHGRHAVVAPLKFIDEVMSRRWHLFRSKDRCRAGDLVVATHPPRNGGPRKPVYLHRFIMELAGCCPAIVDHIDGNPLNNAEDNLRDGKRGNYFNRGLRRDNSSGTPGVSWSKRQMSWHAHVRVNGKRTHLGYFSDIAAARAVRDAAVTRAHGQYAATSAVLASRTK